MSTAIRTFAAERAAEYLQQGFTALKFDPAGPYSASMAGNSVSWISIGAYGSANSYARQWDEGRSALGTHGQMTAAENSPGEAAGALRSTLVRGAGAAGCSGRNGEGCGGDINPIATGERLATRYDSGAASCECGRILQMNLARVGGLLEAKKIAAMAEVDHVQIAPHL